MNHATNHGKSSKEQGSSVNGDRAWYVAISGDPASFSASTLSGPDPIHHLAKKIEVSGAIRPVHNVLDSKAKLNSCILASFPN
jgi:hypothetical protein